MRLRNFCSLAAGFAAIWLGAVAPSVAEEVSFTTLTSFNAMQDRMTEIETRLASLGGGDKDGGKAGCDCGWCGTCTTPGLVVDTELLFLRAYSGDLGQAPSEQYLATPRATLGWVRDDGLGIRARGFIYDSETPGAEGFDVSYGDIEVTDKFQLGCWEGVLSGGARGAHYKESLDLNNIDNDFTGFGPVIGVQVARPLRGNLHLIGAARYAVVFGRDSAFDEREVASIAELQLGTEWRRCLCGTTEAFLRSSWEAQYWGQIANDDEEDFGLIGFGFAAGITR